MEMYLKAFQYGLYMIALRLKAIKLWYIRKTKGIDAGFEYSGKVGRDWADYTINKTLNMKVKVKGRENIPDEPCCFIGNHTSILDVPLLMDSAGRAMGFIAKIEMLKAPVIGYWMNQYNCVPLDRENARAAIKVIQEGAENLKKGYSMAIFPEGTRSQNGKLKEFKKGSIKLATKAKAPIVPVAIDGAYKAFEIDRKFKRNIEVTVTFGKAIYTDNITKEEEKLLMDNIRNFIANELGQE